MREPTATLDEPPAATAHVLPAAYTRTSIALHWLVAVLITAGFTLGLTMNALPISPQRVRLFAYHKWIGITVLGLVLIRSLWRLTHASPPDEPMPRWQAVIAHVTHWILYVLMVILPFSGWLYSSADGYPVVYLKLWQLPDLVPKNKGLAEVLERVHVTLAWVLLGIVVLHVAGALKHHYIDRDATLKRMLGIGARQ